ncbi:MAG: nucleotidyltransferase domain-containing protein [Chitinophagaceae bacterium]|nr:nucleotidyltransferase domain-containing protein [Chitinophagaceae bacterium]
MIYAEHIVRNMIAERVKKKNPDAEVILFGSRARNEQTKNADWDILILLNEVQVSRMMEKEYRDELYNIEPETGQPISTLVFSKKVWEEKHRPTPLYQNIKRDGIYLA